MLLRRLTPFIDAWTANGVRYPISAVLYWPLLYFAFRDGRLTLTLVHRCLVPALFALGGQVFWALAHYELQASEVGFIVRLSTLWAIVGSMILFRDERKLIRRPGFYVGILLIVGGFLSMSMFDRNADATISASTATVEMTQHDSDGSPALATEGDHRLGVFYIVLCGAFFGFYMVSVRRCIPDVDPILAFGVVGNLVSVGTIAGMFLRGNVLLLTEQTPFSWFLLGASSFLGIALGHIMMYVAVQRLGAAITSSCHALMPFITAAVASVTLAESLTGGQWAGGIAMVLGAGVLLSLKHVISEKPHAIPGLTANVDQASRR